MHPVAGGEDAIDVGEADTTRLVHTHTTSCEYGGQRTTTLKGRPRIICPWSQTLTPLESLGHGRIQGRQEWRGHEEAAQRLHRHLK